MRAFPCCSSRNFDAQVKEVKSVFESVPTASSADVSATKGVSLPLPATGALHLWFCDLEGVTWCQDVSTVLPQGFGP